MTRNTAFAGGFALILTKQTMDENLNTPNPETPENEGWEENQVSLDELQEQLALEKSAREKAEAESEKWKSRFKTTKAKENDWAQKFDQSSIQKMVNDSVSTVQFYSENKDANQYKEDIESLVAKWIEREKAFRYVIAEKDPSLLLDDAKKAQLMWNTALNWVPANLGQKDPRSMSGEEIEKLSDAEFDKLFPSQSEVKKFYAQ